MNSGDKSSQLDELSKHLCQQVFDEHVDDVTRKACETNEIMKNIYYGTDYVELFKKYNLEECTMDFLSAQQLILSSVVSTSFSVNLSFVASLPASPLYKR